MVAGELVGMPSPGRKRQGVRPPAEGLEKPVLRVGRGGDRVELRPVAGRQQNAALDQVMVDETANALAHRGFGNEHLFPDVDRGGLMAEADQDEFHRYPGPNIAVGFR